MGAARLGSRGADHVTACRPGSRSASEGAAQGVLAFFLCFFPAWAARFDFVEINWLDKELFLAPPQAKSGSSTWSAGCG
jgi:hypothetical protein